ncbi:unnamed protein product [Haemonchus placei]|uniref:Uncharacterized protein n=1 Tax=Haemonchus placei TaxID=6290 RepID=A0A3P8B881_HAEPC|nr:unnamed protein product [Haemonchus placei]
MSHICILLHRSIHHIYVRICVHRGVLYHKWRDRSWGSYQNDMASLRNDHKVPNLVRLSLHIFPFSHSIGKERGQCVHNPDDVALACYIRSYMADHIVPHNHGHMTGFLGNA